MEESKRIEFDFQFKEGYWVLTGSLDLEINGKNMYIKKVMYLTEENKNNICYRIAHESIVKSLLEAAEKEKEKSLNHARDTYRNFIHHNPVQPLSYFQPFLNDAINGRIKLRNKQNKEKVNWKKEGF